MNRMIFMGTPDLAATILKALLHAGYQVVAAVTKPDKPKGRGKAMSISPVKEVCLEQGIPVLQPERVKTAEFYEELKALKPDIIVVAAYGKILPKEILELPEYGCICVHTSLLPDYRGAAPIQWVILNGEKKTGVTLIEMNEGCDTGDIISSCEVEITADETGESLHDKLAAEGAELLLRTLPSILSKSCQKIPQDIHAGSYVSVIEKSLGCLDFSKPAVELERYIRGLFSWPCAYTYLDGRLIKLFRAEVLTEGSKEFHDYLNGMEDKVSLIPGTVLTDGKKIFAVITGSGILLIRELQPEGKRRMTTEEFLRGYPLQSGMVLKQTSITQE